MSEILIIAHNDDLDGIACHAIVRRYTKLCGGGVEHFFADYENINDILLEVSGEQGREVVIADIGYNEKIMERFDSLKKISEENKVTWFDHHDWSDANLALPMEFVIHPDLCAAELIQRIYLPEDAVSRKIASLAHLSDFRGRSRGIASMLQDVISSGYERLALVKLLADGIFWSDDLEHSRREYRKVKRAAYRYLDAHSKQYNIHGKSCMLGFSQDTLSSNDATEHLLKKSTDFITCIWGSGKMSFRGNSKDLNLTKMASIFSGGGRKSASGGFYRSRVNEDNYLEVFEDIMKELILAYSVFREV